MIKRVLKRCLCVVCVGSIIMSMCLAICASNLFAVSASGVDIEVDDTVESKVLGVTRYVQEEDNWCWAACAQMVGKYITGVKKTQANICDNTLEDILDVGVPTFSMKIALKYSTGRTCKVKGDVIQFKTAKSQINDKRPFVAYVAWDLITGHYVVVDGWKVDDHQKLRVIDPSPNVSKDGISFFMYYKMVRKLKFESGTGTWTDTVFIVKES